MFGGARILTTRILRDKKQYSWHNSLYKANLLLCLLIIISVFAYTASNHLFEQFNVLSGTKTEQLISYKIGSGDTLWQIANKAVTADEDVRDKIIAIQKLNKINSAQALIPGQVIQIPIARVNIEDYKLTFNIR